MKKHKKEDYDFIEIKDACLSPQNKQKTAINSPKISNFKICDSPKTPQNLYEIPPVELCSMYIKCAKMLVNQAKIFIQYLNDNKEAHTVQKYEKFEFFILIHLLGKIKIMLDMLKIPENQKFIMIFVNSEYQKQIITLDAKLLEKIRENKEIFDIKQKLQISYLKLSEILKASAFLLQEMLLFNSLDSGIDNIMYMVDQIQIEENLQNHENMKNRINQCIVMLDIIIEEYCIFSLETENKIWPVGWCRFFKEFNQEKASKNMKNQPEILLEIKDLLEKKLKSIIK